MRIRIHPSLYIYLTGIAVLSSLQTCIAMLLALLVHETGHLLVCRLFGEQIDLLELTPAGGIITRRNATPAHKGVRGICVHAAGPISNYLMLLLSGSVFVQHTLDAPFLRNIIVCNVSMMMLNMMPVLPLDGGYVLLSIGYYFFPMTRLVFALSGMGILIGIFGILLVLYGIAFQKILNCSLLIISIHLIISAKRVPNALLAENIWTIVHERLLDSARIRRVAHYQVSPDTPLFELVPLLKHGFSVCFTFSVKGNAYSLGEEDFCRALLQTPSICIAQVLNHGANTQK